MANQEQNPPQQEQPSITAKQVGFNLKDIILNTNNEVALLYPEHNNKDDFKCVFDFISKCYLRKPFTIFPNMYKEYLAEFWYLDKALKNSKVSFPILTGGIKPGAQTGHKKPLTSSKQPCVSSKEATKGGSSKAPTSSKTGHSKKIKESISAMDSNPSSPLVSTPMDIGMHKEDQQATGGPTSLGVTSEERANPQLSSGMSVFNLNKPIFSASFIIYSESASGCDASVNSTAEVDPGLFAPNDSIP
ncbi:hypothetical protein Tco_1049759 [Tanacetum coccineum]